MKFDSIIDTETPLVQPCRMNSPALGIERLIRTACELAASAGVTPRELFLGIDEKAALRTLINAITPGVPRYKSIEGVVFMGMIVRLSGVPGAAVRD